VAGTFIGLELVSNNLLEPWVYGSKSGLSTVAVLLAALFWGWLWGAMGIVLAVPMTVILVVLGRYLPQLAPFTILFGDEQSLPEGVRFYHRVLAGDEVGAAQLARTVLAARGEAGVVDDLLVPGAAEEKRDRLRGTLDPQLSDRYLEFVEDVAATQLTAPEASHGPMPVDETPPRSTWCVPVADDAELFNARLLAHLLRSAGERAEVVTVAELETIDEVPERVVVLACAPIEQGRLRHTVRAVRSAANGARLAVHISGQVIHAHLAERLKRLGVVEVTTRLAPLIEPGSAEPPEAPPAVEAGMAEVRPARAV
jgi:hypothetical protein